MSRGSRMLNGRGLIWTITTFACIFTLVGLTANLGSAAVSLRLSHPSQPNTPVANSFELFKSIVERNSKGELKVDLFGAGVLGSEIEATEQLLMGQIDIAVVATTNYSGKSNTYQAFDLPYVFTDHAEWRYQFGGVKGTGGGLLRELQDYVITKEDTMLLGFVAPGLPKSIANSRRLVKTPDDAKGLKIRVSASPVEAALMKEWGFTPVPIPWPETYSAIAQKVVDGSVTQWLVGGQMGHFDIMKYNFEPEAVNSAYVILMNGKKWKSLSSNLQQILLRAAAESTLQCWADIEKVNDEWKDKALKKGVETYFPTGDVKAEWYNLAMKVWPAYSPKVDQQVLNMVEKHKKLYQEYLKKK
jgi:TRAP-type C4-dicarboxylate transport system substrate-binding protein